MATISLSPRAVIGGIAGSVVAVAGIGTAFAGSPFTLSGGSGAAISGQSVAGATRGAIVVTAGLAGHGPLTITDTGSGASAPLSVVTPPTVVPTCAAPKGRIVAAAPRERIVKTR